MNKTDRAFKDFNDMMTRFVDDSMGEVKRLNPYNSCELDELARIMQNWKEITDEVENGNFDNPIDYRDLAFQYMPCDKHKSKKYLLDRLPKWFFKKHGKERADYTFETKDDYIEWWVSQRK